MTAIVTTSTTDTAALLKAIAFAADKHRQQRRKGLDSDPYINHPIAVANILANIGNITELPILLAAVLHDTIEDTDTGQEEILQLFGIQVLNLVLEVTDNPHLSKPARKQLQIQNLPDMSTGAKCIRLADKISNMLDITFHPPLNWSPQRCAEYIDWSEQILVGCKGINTDLEYKFQQVIKAARTAIITR